MKTLKNTLRLAVIALVLVFASCSKDESPSEDSIVIEQPTNHELLMSGKWYVQSTTSGGSFDECSSQTYFQFVTEDTLLIQAYGLNGMNCEADTLQSVEYQMTGTDTFIFVESPAFYFVVEYITESELILRQTDDVDSNVISFQK